jgi:nucleoside-diphosphate-sugar epimerase
MLRVNSPNRHRTMLITGATGFIGSRLACMALQNQYLVRTLSRSDWSGSPAVPREQRCFGSLPDEIPDEAMHAVDVVVHCAAWIHEGEKVATAVNVEGSIRLAELALKERVENFIYLSSQSSRPDALSAYGKTKYAAEQALLSMNGINVIILRPGLVVGPGSTGLYHRLNRMVGSMPVIPLLGGGRAIVQPIHVDDLCAAIFRCDEIGVGLNKTILKLGHSEGMTLTEFLQAISQARQGVRKMTLSIPLWPVEIVVRLFESLGISLPITSGNLKGIRRGEKMDTAADMARLNLILRPINEMLLN